MHDLITMINSNVIDVVTFDGHVYKTFTLDKGVYQDDDEVFTHQFQMLEFMGWHAEWREEADIYFKKGNTQTWGFIA
jgi:hypothetical protein